MFGQALCVAPVAVVDSPLPLGSFEFALKTGPLRTT